MDFRQLQDHMIDHLRDRIRSGEITERGLARLAGVSQPHIHNVLRGKRFFSPKMADDILRRLGLDLLDLIEPAALLSVHRRR